MIQKSFFVAVLVLAHGSSMNAQTKQQLTIESATVFLSGAELTSTARINLVKGENEVLFTNVAGDVNSQSLTVGATNGVVVESATFQNNYLAAEELSTVAEGIKDSIELLTEAKTLMTNKIAVLNEQQAVLQGNRKIGGDNTGLSVAELGKMLDLINARMEAMLTQKSKLNELVLKTDERIDKLELQLAEEQKKAYQPGGQLMVKLYAREATTTMVTISYVVPNAGWAPTYDVFADEVNQPVKLHYKANIYQNSGVKWNNVHLTLSTGNSREGVQAPVMDPWYLSLYVPAVYNTLTKEKIGTVPTTQVTDLISMAPGQYQSKRGGDVNMSGARTSGSLYIIDGVQVRGTTGVNMSQNSIDQYVTVDNAGVNTSFDIELPYTIPSDGKQHLVAIKKYDVPATYRYYAAPRLDKDAFLQAQITNWEDLNLLPGQTNIFYEGTFVGQGTIDVRNIKDTMTISLGRDKKVVVKRERDTKLRSVKTIGTNVKESFAYTLSVRNTRKEPINIVLQDQLPVSNDKDIAIEDIETAGAEQEETTGMLKWGMSLAPNETQKVTFGYTVKYPKGKIVNGLR